MTEPPDAGITVPTPPLIDALVAPVLVQESVDEPPSVIEAGLALKVPVGGAFSVTVAVLVVVPPGPVNVSV